VIVSICVSRMVVRVGLGLPGRESIDRRAVRSVRNEAHLVVDIIAIVDADR
jgi:hypothetical protein